ncbi:MAG: TlpA family protein disulfide reductase [Planctomycetales bacterium]|nr:TlpA family protein disulfide reductase [Planctomycetales bacterium]
MTKTWVGSWAAIAVLVAAGFATAEEPAAPAAEAASETYAGDANDADALLKYAGEAIGKISALIASDPTAAEKRLAALEEEVNSLKIDKGDAEDVRRRVTDAVRFFRGRIELAQVSLADLEAALTADPNDETAIQKYVGKAMMELRPLTDSKPDEAEAKLTAMRKFLDTVAAKAEGDDAKRNYARAGSMLDSIQQDIEDGRRLAELVGKDATPLEVEAWANGEPLTDGDLKGKVVLLDFWAVWCGPCIATFPHLREWQEEFGDKGLVIIGLTSYYNYRWDEAANRAVRSTDKVAPEDEQAMLGKFAELHQLHHRFAVQKGRGMSEYYAVSGIPHAVVIDRQGKVALIRVGSGGSNAEDIHAMIEKLIAQ